MTSVHVKPPKTSRPSRAGKENSDGFKPALSKGLSRLFQPVQNSDYSGRVQTHAQQGFHPSSTTIRLTDVCPFRAARLSAPVNLET